MLGFPNCRRVDHFAILFPLQGREHPDQVCLRKIISLCQVLEECCCSQSKTHRVTPEEVAAKIDLYLRGAADLGECLARLEKARPPSVMDASLNWNVVFPGVEAEFA